MTLGEPLLLLLLTGGFALSLRNERPSFYVLHPNSMEENRTRVAQLCIMYRNVLDAAGLVVARGFVPPTMPADAVVLSVLAHAAELIGADPRLRRSFPAMRVRFTAEFFSESPEDLDLDALGLLAVGHGDDGAPLYGAAVHNAEVRALSAAAHAVAHRVVERLSRRFPRGARAQLAREGHASTVAVGRLGGSYKLMMATAGGGGGEEQVGRFRPAAESAGQRAAPGNNNNDYDQVWQGAIGALTAGARRARGGGEGGDDASAGSGSQQAAKRGRQRCGDAAPPTPAQPPVLAMAPRADPRAVTSALGLIGEAYGIEIGVDGVANAVASALQRQGRSADIRHAVGTVLLAAALAGEPGSLHRTLDDSRGPVAVPLADGVLKLPRAALVLLAALRAVLCRASAAPLAFTLHADLTSRIAFGSGAGKLDACPTAILLESVFAGFLASDAEEAAGQLILGGEGQRVVGDVGREWERYALYRTWRDGGAKPRGRPPRVERVPVVRGLRAGDSRRGCCGSPTVVAVPAPAALAGFLLGAHGVDRLFGRRTAAVVGCCPAQAHADGEDGCACGCPLARHKILDWSDDNKWSWTRRGEKDLSDNTRVIARMATATDLFDSVSAGAAWAGRHCAADPGAPPYAPPPEFRGIAEPFLQLYDNPAICAGLSAAVPWVNLLRVISARELGLPTAGGALPYDGARGGSDGGSAGAAPAADGGEIELASDDEEEDDGGAAVIAVE